MSYQYLLSTGAVVPDTSDLLSEVQHLSNQCSALASTSILPRPKAASLQRLRSRAAQSSTTTLRWQIRSIQT